MTLEHFVSIMLWIVAAYAVIGLGFGLWQIVYYFPQQDKTVREGNLPFRLIILPGFMVLWPLLWLKPGFLGGVDGPFSIGLLKFCQGMAVLILALLIPPIAFFALAKPASSASPAQQPSPSLSTP
jgi:hypothetical protein